MTTQPPDTTALFGAPHLAHGWLVAVDLFVLTFALSAAVVLVIATTPPQLCSPPSGLRRGNLYRMA